MNGTAVGPDMKPVPMKIEQTAPGRYVGTFPANDAGSYFIMLSPGAGQAPIRTGINVPYSDEFRDRSPNEALLEQLAAIDAQGRQARQSDRSPKLKTPTPWNNCSRSTPSATICPRPPAARTPGIICCSAASCLFFGDVFFRRVQVNFAWVPPLAGRARDWVLRRQPQAGRAASSSSGCGAARPKSPTRSSNSAARSASRCRKPQKPADLTVLEEPPAADKPAKPADKPSITEPQKTEARKLHRTIARAKKKVWEDRDKK